PRRQRPCWRQGRHSTVCGAASPTPDCWRGRAISAGCSTLWSTRGLPTGSAKTGRFRPPGSLGGSAGTWRASSHGYARLLKHHRRRGRERDTTTSRQAVRRTNHGHDVMKPTVFIHTNDKQMLGAKVSAYSLARNSANADRFDVRILRREDFPFFEACEGRPFLRAGASRIWRNDDLQSFTPLRFMPPELMGYEGRAVVIDPDVFAVGEVWELLSRDMQDKAIMARPRP